MTGERAASSAWPACHPRPTARGNKRARQQFGCGAAHNRPAIAAGIRAQRGRGHGRPRSAGAPSVPAGGSWESPAASPRPSSRVAKRRQCPPAVRGDPARGRVGAGDKPRDRARAASLVAPACPRDRCELPRRRHLGPHRDTARRLGRAIVRLAVGACFGSRRQTRGSVRRPLLCRLDDDLPPGVEVARGAKAGRLQLGVHIEMAIVPGERLAVVLGDEVEQPKLERVASPVG